MMLPRLALVLLVLVVLPAQAATLELMTLEEMVQQSTAIVRARAGQSRTERSGALLYTVTQLEVLEQWKGTAARLRSGPVRGLPQPHRLGLGRSGLAVASLP